MKIIIFSDSHGSSKNLKKVIDKTLSTTDLYIHLGDGINEFNILRENYPEKGFISVRGNCDTFSSCETDETVINFEGYRVLITHGHKYANIKGIAKARDADVVLSGHTHKRYYEHDNGLHIFNPGSISRPRDGKSPSYGVMEIRNGILFSHGEV